jgi:hypothetical protein
MVEPGSKSSESPDGHKFSIALYLKKYLSERIGEMMTEHRHKRLQHIGLDSIGQPYHSGSKDWDMKLTVNDVEFAYNNHELIHLLEKRGTAIT